MKRYKDSQPNQELNQLNQEKAPFHMELTARLLLDNLCYGWNENYLLEQINYALDTSNKKMFTEYSLKYKKFKNQ